ncbi:MAG: hydroxyacylglutathione hydrolase, partial [Psychrobium sp.]|nr:hydroxyacylglutathione hydrolase [Psychrobium sp.]
HIIDVPGHTLGHIAFVDDASLFCGDTLFAGGCGRMFEGSAEQFQHSLATLAKLPPTTKIYCAHEYTLANLDFALTVEPHNLALIARIDYCRQQRVCNEPTIPSTIEQELSSNPFFRVGKTSVQQAIADKHKQTVVTDVIENFALLRAWKDNF